MVDVDKAVIARLKLENHIFEILVDCEKAMEFKHGKSISILDIVASDVVFKDVKKGLHAPENEMHKIFGTDDSEKIISKIIKEGDVQLTIEYRNKLREEKRKQIIYLIAKNSIDPKTNLPHPAKRIELALEQSKVKIDEFKKPEEQVNDIVSSLRAILPIKFEVRELAVKIPAQFAGKSYHILKEYGKVLKDEWQNDGSLIVLMEMPAGIQNEFFDKMNGLTHGDVDIKVVKIK